jgi:hypothetical protein
MKLKMARKWPENGYREQPYYDGNIWWHHMAFVWALLWSRVTPFVFVEKSGPINGRNSTELTAAVRKLRWVEGASKSHKGVTDSVLRFGSVRFFDL